MTVSAQNESEDLALRHAEAVARRMLSRVQKLCGQREASLSAVAAIIVGAKFLAEFEGDQTATDILHQIFTASVKA